MTERYFTRACLSQDVQPHRVRIILIMFFLLGIITVRLDAQQIIYDQKDILNNYDNPCYDNHISFFPSIACRDSINGTFNVLPLYLNAVDNSTYARGMNDGPAWQGRGANLTAGFGFSGRFGKVTYVLNPMLEYSQNLPYDSGVGLTSRGQQYEYPFIISNFNIDYVTRYGPNPDFFFFPGESEIALSLKPVTFSLSTQNMRWGPAIYNPIVMSTNAGGIPHLRIGTTKPVSTSIGKVEGQIMWGLMRESDYFNTNPNDNLRYFTGITIGYSPSFFKGFSFSIQRILYTQTQYLNGIFRNGLAAFSGFFGSKGSVVKGVRYANDVYDQILSFGLRYENKEQHFNVYLEWGRGDFAGDVIHYIEQPFDDSGFTMGFWKEFPISSDKKIRLIFENTTLATWSSRFTFGYPITSFYVHQLNYQGYTNNGQIMGAWIGPGSSSDEIRLSYFWKKQSISLDIQRTRFNDDYFYTQFKSRLTHAPDVEFQEGLQYESHRFSHFSYNIGVFTGIRANYLYNPSSVKFNLHTKMSLRYYFK